MDIDRLSRLPVDVFIQEITYLPFQDVVNVCSANVKLRAFCNDPTYNTKWKALINNTFKDSVYSYDDKLVKLWEKLNTEPETYNYLVYTRLVKLLDPVTQAMIYYRQGDMKSFEQLTQVQKFLAMFLLNKSYEMKNYLPNDNYVPFISMLSGDKIDQNILNKMLIEMAKEGNMKGLKYFEEKGANISAEVDRALGVASREGHLEVVKYLVEHRADIHAGNDLALALASQKGHLEVVKYLVEQGANVRALDDGALRVASENGHLEVVKYLVEHGANVHALDDLALALASQKGHLEVVKYLVEHRANIHALDDYALVLASSRGHLEVVKYLIENGANIHARDDGALRWARKNGHLDVVTYLESLD